MKIIPLDGSWQLYMDKEKSPLPPQVYNDSINLPDTTSHACKGTPNSGRDSGYLTDLYPFYGFAWYCRQVEITDDLQDKDVTLLLERTRKTVLYINGEKIGSRNSLCAPHRYKLTTLINGVNTITLLVDNTDYPTPGGHLTSPDTQTNWNGVIGKIQLEIRDKIHPEQVRVYSDVKNNSVRVNAKICGAEQGVARICIKGAEGESYFDGEAPFSGGVLDKSCKLTKAAPLWDEFSPNLLTMELTVGNETETVSLGMRSLETKGLTLLINGKEAFLRGKHDGLVWPLTGYAPADREEWLRVMTIAKEYGFNHYRFHTCCPPEAAFEAADILGIYMEPELPFWGTVAAEDEEGYNGEEQAYLIKEGFAILSQYGNHPSFAMMSMGNELWGSRERINAIVSGFKETDSRHLYTAGSNNHQFCPEVLPAEDFFCGVRFDANRLIRGSYAMCDAPQGHIQTAPPDSLFNYDGMICPDGNDSSENGGKRLIQYGTGVKEVEVSGGGSGINVPVISHEIGQYEIYPDFSEAERYTGPLKPRYMDIYREKLAENGLSGYEEKFFRASGALAVQCYKHELEAAQRSGRLSGFQLLDLQDFPGQGVATVGILNALMESKGLIEAERWRDFCAPTIVLAELEKFVWKSGEEMKIGVLLSDSFPHLTENTVSYAIDGDFSAKGELKFAKSGGRVTRVGEIIVRPVVEKPSKLTLTMKLGAAAQNSYDFYVIPEQDVTITSDKIVSGGKKVTITGDFEQAKSLQNSGEGVLFVPDSTDKLEATYCTDFWCYPMFRSISESMNKPVPIGTLGLLIDKNEAVLDGFPTESFTTPLWYELVSHAHCEDLTGTDIKPSVMMIDNPDRCRKLGILYRRDGVLCCTVRLWEAADKEEAKLFAAGIVKALCR